MRNLIKRFLPKLILLGFLLMFAMQIHNLLEYPLYKSFDSKGHLEYIDYLKTNKKIPLANEGWELYQPPLYYLILTIFGGEVVVKPLSLIVWMLFGLLVARSLKYVKEDNLTLVGFLYILPVFIYSSLQVGNEFFSAFMISASLVYYLINQEGMINNNQKQLILGTLLGLSILSKATGWVLAFSIFIHFLFIRSGKLRNKIAPIFKTLLVMLLVGGWYYFRNLVLLGNPFATSVDYPQYFIHQAPGYRNVEFFTTLRGFFSLDLYKSHWYSLWSGLYYTWFYDAHNAILPIVEFSKIGVITVVYSIPLLVLSILGMFDMLKKKSLSILPIYSFLLFISFVFYNIKLPFYSTVKAMFLLSLVIPYILSVSFGIYRLKVNKLLIGLYVLGMMILMLDQFWVDKAWYAHYISYLI